MFVTNFKIQNSKSPQRLINEFEANENILAEMKQEVEAYQQKGKTEAAHRLRDQVSLLEDRFRASQEKLDKFTSPQANFESRLNRALGELRGVERISCILDVASAGPGNVQDQYNHCRKMYRTLSEIKSEIESVIKTGRKVCEEKTTKHPKKLSQSIDALKHLYNALGEHVTQSKNSLEKLLRLMSTLQSKIDVVEKWLDFSDEIGSVSNEQRKKIAGNDFTLTLSNGQIAEMLDKCNELYVEYNQICDTIYLEELRTKLDQLSERFILYTDNDVGKSLLEIKSTLQNLDNVSIDTLR